MTYPRLIAFALVFLAMLYLPLPIFIIVALVYASVFSALEILPLAVVVDATFGNPGAGIWCIYTLSVSAMLLVLAYVKPHLRFYT